MRLLFLFLLTTYFGSFLIAQPFQIEYINDANNPEVTFPILSSKDHPYIAKKINQYLQIEVLGHLYDTERDSVFNNISWDEINHTINLIDCVIWENNKAILSIVFTYETSLRYDQNYSYYNFNSATGDLIEIEELFTPTSFNAFRKYATKLYLDELQKNAKTEFRNSIKDSSYIDETIDEMFYLIQCNSGSGYTPHDFYFNNGYLVLNNRSNCYHARIFYLWNLPIKYTTLHKKKLLNLYGKQLTSKVPCPNRRIGGRKHILLSGTIDNQYDITMSLWLTKKGEIYNASGQYWYSKYGIPIELEGSGSSLDKIRLKGEDGQFILTIGDEVTGTWQGKKGKELLVFMN